MNEIIDISSYGGSAEQDVTSVNWGAQFTYHNWRIGGTYYLITFMIMHIQMKKIMAVLHRSLPVISLILVLVLKQATARP